ncbi:uncharacterized protein LOC129280302 [Lytechinus pictus]|uniref:uncharacterized protein LOC129280302 n=1 Tax=Lytechinus pictus TaxID=7653 RepID=UPI00240E48EA|nr:uncharacterized protein LOC129280302 [Lytechinus pictus]
MADQGMATTTKPGRIGLWCVPRSTSTLLAKCLSAIEGIEVHLDVYSYASTFRGLYKTSTGKELPSDLNGNESVYEEANDVWEKNVGNRDLIPRKTSYQTIKEDLEKASAKYVLIKEMGVLPIDPKFYPEGYKFAFLIRDPSRVYVSARKSMGAKYVETGMVPSEADYDLIRDDQLDSQPMKWFEREHALWKHVKANIDPDPIIIDTSDIMSRPGPTIKAFCDAVGLPYSDDLLQMKPLTEMPSNFVTAAENLFTDMSAFYERAFKSTQIIPPKDVGPLPRDQLSDDVGRCVDYSMPFYREMFESRLHIPS